MCRNFIVWVYESICVVCTQHGEVAMMQIKAEVLMWLMMNDEIRGALGVSLLWMMLGQFALLNARIIVFILHSHYDKQFLRCNYSIISIGAILGCRDKNRKPTPRACESSNNLMFYASSTIKWHNVERQPVN